MNIYFSCSITGGRQDQAVYQALVDWMLSCGHEVPTAVLASAEVGALETVVSPADVYHRDIAWIDACDAVVAEVSTPSHGVGYEIAYALGTGKPVLCCYQQGRRVSKMLTGNDHPGLRVVSYASPQEALAMVSIFIQEIRPV